MTARPVRMVLLALGIAVLVGAAVGGLSQMTAVSTVDPRSSNPPVITPTPVPEPSATPTPSPSPSESSTPAATESAEAGGEVWLYTIADGDSISRMAIRFGTTTGELLTLNPEFAENQDLVEVGAQIIMPCTPIASAEDRC